MIEPQFMKQWNNNLFQLQKYILLYFIQKCFFLFFSLLNYYFIFFSQGWFINSITYTCNCYCCNKSKRTVLLLLYVCLLWNNFKKFYFYFIRYDCSRSLEDNVGLASPLLSRFDLILLLRDDQDQVN